MVGSRLRPMRDVTWLRSAGVISAGHAFVPNLRRGPLRTRGRCRSQTPASGAAGGSGADMIGRSDQRGTRSADLTTQHRHLVPQNQELHILEAGFGHRDHPGRLICEAQDASMSSAFRQCNGISGADLQESPPSNTATVYLSYAMPELPKVTPVVSIIRITRISGSRY